ncbi:MAG: transporter substrate-binding domain-containing protein [Campylobacter sp.]|nr:transporter substrate-binding domain-containing protein [Campylobacter sp.]
MRILVLVVLFCISAFSYTLDEIKSSKKIRIGVWNDKPPFSNLVDGEFKGFEVDLAKKLAKELIGEDAQIEFFGISSADERAIILNNNLADIVIASFANSDEKVDFAMPYFMISQGVLVKKGSPIKTLNDLKGKKLTALQGSYAQDFLSEFKECDIALAYENSEALDLLELDFVDGYVDDNLLLLNYSVSKPDLTMPSELTKIGKTTYLAPAVKKDNVELKKEIDKYMVELNKNGFFKVIYDLNFSTLQSKSHFFLLEDFYTIFG